MNQLAAMRETLTRAQECGMADIGGLPEGCDYWHLQDMVEHAQTEAFSESKMGRWLGWMQCAVVAADIGLTLEDMKQINLSYADHLKPVRPTTNWAAESTQDPQHRTDQQQSNADLVENVDSQNGTEDDEKYSK